MSQIVKLRRSSVSGQKPTNSNLQLGELALNTTDGKVFMAVSGSGGPSIQELLVTNTVNTGSVNVSGSINLTGSLTTTHTLSGSALHIVSGFQPQIQLQNTTTGREYHIGTGARGLLSIHDGDNQPIAHFSTSSADFEVNIIVTGSVSATEFTGSALGLTNVPFQISGSDLSGNTFNKQFTKLQFDDSTGLNVEETDPGTAFISIGSHFKDIFVDGQTILSATGSDAFEIIPDGGIEITTSITDTNSNGYTKELKISANSLSQSLNDRIDLITGSMSGLSGNVYVLDEGVDKGQVTHFDFIGEGVTAVVNAGTASITIPGGTGGGTGMGSYSSLIVTNALSTWSFQHNTGQKYPIFQVFDNNGYVVIPSQIQTIDENNANIVFSSPQTGRVIASLGGGNGTTEAFTNSDLWVVNHNLGTDYPDVTVWDSNRNIVFPNRIESVNSNQIKIYFSQAISGNVSVSRGGHIVSGSGVIGLSDITWTNLLNKPNGIVSGSSQLTPTFDTRYVLSGSITQTTWDNIANKPSGLISGSLQVNLTGTTGYSTFSGSISSSIGSLSSSIVTTTNDLSGSISSSIGFLSSSVASIDNTQNGRLTSLETESGSIRSTFNTFTSSHTTGAFTGSFKGDGSGLYNVPASGVTGLNLSQISSGSATASISPNNGLVINTNTTITGSLTVSGSFNYVGPQSITGSQQISGSISLYPTQDPDPLGQTTTATHLFVSASNNQTGEDLYIRQQDNKVKWKWFEGKLNTGILWGGALSYSGSTIYITKGSGIIVDQRASATSEISPITHYVDWNDITASCQHVTSSLATYVGIDISGSLYQQDNYFSVNQYRQTIPLGMFNHTNKSSITSYANDVLTSYDDVNQTANFIQAFGPIKLEGLTLTPQSGNLQLTIGSGQSYIYGGFYQQDPNNSSHKITAPVITPQIARVRRDGNGSFTVDNNNGAFYSTIETSHWDDGTGTLNSLGGNYAIQRVFFNPFTNRVHVYYGQSYYGTKTAAFQSLASDPFSEAPYSAHQYVFLGYIIHKGGASDLSDSNEVQIIQSGLFRNTVGSGGNVGTFASLHDLDDVDILNPNNGDLLRYNSTTNLWEHSKQLTGDYQITGSLRVIGDITAQQYIVSSSITHLTQSFSSGSTIFGDSTNDTHIFTGSILVDGNVSANSLTGSINFNNLTNVPTLVSGSSQIVYSGVTGIPSGVVSGSSQILNGSGIVSSSSQISYTEITNIPSGIVSGSEQLTGSYDTRYVLSGSITQTTWDNIANKPNGIISGSSQLPSGLVSGSEQLTGSYDTRYVLSGSITQTTWDNIASKPSGIVSGSSQIVGLGFLQTSSFNTFTSSVVTRLDSIESVTGSFATTGSNAFVGTERINGDLIVTGSVIISGSFDLTNAQISNSRYLHTQTSGSTTWTIYHNLSYDYPNVIVYDNYNKVMLPADITSINANTTQLTFAIAESGHALVSIGGISTGTADRFLYTASPATGSWVIDHNLGYKYVNIDVYDENDEQLIPQKVTAVSINRTQIDFATPTSGNAIITIGGARSTSLFVQNGSYYNATTNIGITGSLVVTGDVDASNFNTTSDKKLKTNLVRIEGALDKIEKLNGYTFNWLEEYSEDKTRQIGMIADEVYEVQPELISNRTIMLGGKEEEIKLLDYSKVTALLIEAIKELNDKVTKIENKRKKK
jgi:hypothetical protein